MERKTYVAPQTVAVAPADALLYSDHASNPNTGLQDAKGTVFTDDEWQDAAKDEREHLRSRLWED